jgi:general secretion pathway protein G
MGREQAGRARSAGFTLIELVIVVTIITILATALTVEAGKRIKAARRARAVQDIRVLETALDSYAADNIDPPTTQQGLRALIVKPTSAPVPSNWNGPYLKKRSVPKDPWGREYVYRYPGQSNPDTYDLICYGHDGQPGGDDDDADISSGD